MATEYNGWSNFETWTVNMWIDNEESTQTFWQDRAADAMRASRMYPVDYLTVSQDARVRLAGELKEWAEDSAPDLGASLWADLLGAALSEVDWAEIADSMLTESEGYVSAE